MKKYVIYVLFLAAWNGNITSSAETGDHNIEDKNEKLMSVAKSGNLQDLRAIIADGADIDYMDRYGRTPLSVAVHFNSRDMVKGLVESGANSNHGRNGWEPLFLAILQDNTSLLQYLLENGADINFIDNFGNTALEWAVEHNKSHSIEFLLKRGANARLVRNPFLKDWRIQSILKYYSLLRSPTRWVFEKPELHPATNLESNLSFQEVEELSEKTIDRFFQDSSDYLNTKIREYLWSYVKLNNPFPLRTFLSETIQKEPGLRNEIASQFTSRQSFNTFLNDIFDDQTDMPTMQVMKGALGGDKEGFERVMKDKFVHNEASYGSKKRAREEED